MDPKYIVVECQTNADGTVSSLISAYDTRNQAESAYHTVLAAAAISTLPAHAAIISTTEGSVLESRCFFHGGDSA